MKTYINIFLILFLISSNITLANEAANKAIDVNSNLSEKKRSSTEIVQLAWAASSKNDLNTISALVDEIKKNYEVEAKVLASHLKDFPSREMIADYAVMRNMATALFIKAEALMRQGNNEEAIKLFEEVIVQYPWSQCFDPSRGSYWSIKEKSQASIDVMTGKTPKEEPVVVKQGPRTVPNLAFPGKVNVVNYEKYGKFLNKGTKDFHYQLIDRQGLSEAVGEGIYPNIGDVYKDQNYKKTYKEGRLEGNIWDFINTQDLEAAFYKWATSSEPDGVKLFYLGIIFEKAKMYFEAIKCYQSIIINFPQTLAWTYWHTPWYPSQASVAKIHHIIRMHPELKLSFKGAQIHIKNSFDNDPANDVTTTFPGNLRQYNAMEKVLRIEKQKIRLGVPKRSIGKGRVRFVQYSNKHWQLLVKNKPFIIHGITYAATKVGQGPDDGTLTNWMTDDFNQNGKIDGPYEAFMDKNLNNKQDDDEPSVGDFGLMKEMGVNTLRIYDHPDRPLKKEFLQKMYKDYGFMVIAGNLLGKYAVGSGASWTEGTDYENPVHRKNMMESVKKMVMDFKDEPYILMWLIGNENNYGVASNGDKKPEVYYKFANEVAKMIKSIDPNHPVALCNGDILFLDIYGKNAPDIDAYAANVYRGDYGFGSYWQQVREVIDKPTFITEYGAPAFSGSTLSPTEALEAQASYHKGNWLDIQYNSAEYSEGEGNSIGGVAFEWLDEWWKNYEPTKHDSKADVVGPFPGGYYYEEWFGILGQGNGRLSPYLREPRAVFYTYKDLWNSKE